MRAKVKPNDDESEARVSNLVHWGYGTAWGGVRGLLESAGLSGLAGTAAHLGLVWGAEQIVLPALDVSAPRVHKENGSPRLRARRRTACTASA